MTRTQIALALGVFAILELPNAIADHDPAGNVAPFLNALFENEKFEFEEDGMNRPGYSGDSLVWVRPPWPTLPVADSTRFLFPSVARCQSARRGVGY